MSYALSTLLQQGADGTKNMNSRAMNSKPYGMYSNAADSTGGSRPNSAGVQRPTTAATAAARGGSIGACSL